MTKVTGTRVNPLHDSTLQFSTTRKIDEGVKGECVEFGSVDNVRAYVLASLDDQRCIPH